MRSVAVANQDDPDALAVYFYMIKVNNCCYLNLSRRLIFFINSFMKIIYEDKNHLDFMRNLM
ncbi:MAG: hypothetical protein Fur0025_15290 [Oscillatoriaceae cyanobacterium]